MLRGLLAIVPKIAKVATAVDRHINNVAMHYPTLNLLLRQLEAPYR